MILLLRPPLPAFSWRGCKASLSICGRSGAGGVHFNALRRRRSCRRIFGGDAVLPRRSPDSGLDGDRCVHLPSIMGWHVYAGIRTICCESSGRNIVTGSAAEVRGRR